MLFRSGEISFQRRPVGSYGKYHIMSKGGSARRFYGNYEYVIRLRDLYDPSKTNVSVRRGDQDYYFKKAIGCQRRKLPPTLCSW